MNKVFLIGTLTRDPELTQTATGVSLCRIAIAVNRNFTNANGEREADFFNVTVWRNQAENCHRFLKKGNKICVTGALQTRTTENPDGTKKYFTDIVADEVEFLTPREAGGAPRPEGDNAPPRKSIRDNPPVSDDELPF